LLKICETFVSIQGESTRAGRVCGFVRLAGCNLACAWCDTPYAATVTKQADVETVVSTVCSWGGDLVEITGGEPLLQSDTARLCATLIERGMTVLVETNGTRDIGVLPAGVIRIVDVKTPSSGVTTPFLSTNIAALTKIDEVKFVIGDRRDFDWMLAFYDRHLATGPATVLASPLLGQLAAATLAEWIIGSRRPVRLNLQLHKFIWPPNRRGV